MPGAGKRTGFRGPDGNSSLLDNVSYLRGKHGFKFGVQFIDIIYDNDSYQQPTASVRFKTLKAFSRATCRKGRSLLVIQT